MKPGVAKIKGSKIYPVEVYKRYDGTTLYAKNQISGFSTYAKNGYTYSNLRVSGSQTEVGRSISTIDSIVIYDPYGNNVTEYFTISTGTIHVYYWEITVASDGGTFYFGDSVSAANTQNITLSGDPIQTNHNIDVQFKDNYSKVGSHRNRFSVAIYDDYGNDVSVQYRINKQEGSLNIMRIDITLEAGSASKQYDGEALSCKDYIMTGALADGDYISACTIEGEQLYVGKSANRITKVIICDSNGNDVTYRYNVKTVNGVLKVTIK